VAEKKSFISLTMLQCSRYAKNCRTLREPSDQYRN
jgi:hypothetical protein